MDVELLLYAHIGTVGLRKFLPKFISWMLRRINASGSNWKDLNGSFMRLITSQSDNLVAHITIQNELSAS
jgi:hypothetical protein